MTKIWLAATAIFFLVATTAIIAGQVLPCVKVRTTENALYCLDLTHQVKPVINLAAKATGSDALMTISRALKALDPLQGEEKYLLGIGQAKPTTYLVLLQNNNELRTSGGFFGSYAVINAHNGRFDIRFQDIYVPDGQLSGHVEPPPPIQEAFQQGWWKLRDADWYPDFPTSATTIRWFFTQGKEIDPDFLITLNLDTIQEILKIIGPIEVASENLLVTADNIWEVLQTRAEVGFFPGSTQKKDALNSIGKPFLEKSASLDPDKQLAIVKLLLDQLERQNILVNAKRPKLQNIFLAKNWGGELSPQRCTSPGCLSDSLAIIESNLGANKANCCIERLAQHQLMVQNNFVVHEITLTYQNSSQSENPEPPKFYGGNYIQYLRLYLPIESQFVEIAEQSSLPTTLADYPLPLENSSQPPQTAEKFGFREYGFFHLTRAGSTSQVRISYSLPINGQEKYQISIVKQHGQATFPQTINAFNQQLQTNLENDFQAELSLP